MTMRVLLLVPVGLTFDALPQAQQDAVRSVFGQFVMPMPGTVAHGGNVVVDAVTEDNFKPETMADYGITWPIIGLWRDTGEAIVPLDGVAFLSYLPPTQTRDENGNPVGAPAPPTLHEPHRWAGWEPLF